MTTAFAALFAACSNEDFLDNVQNVAGTQDAQRPTVDNVVLNLVEDGAETRLGYGLGGYVWEKDDVLGALLMDDWNDNKLNGDRPSKVNHKEEWADYSWTQRYVLSDQIHTDYPFKRQDDGTWSCDTKMQEGNYFFAFPFTSYDGKREALHNLSEQVQDGVTTESLQEAYAKNNFFIGYARIKAGTESEDVVSANLKMTPVLGAVGITVKNVGTGEFSVKKIVLESDDFSTVIKVDPTKAEYKGEDDNIANTMQLPYYNVDVTESGWPLNYYFNYANYEEMNFDGSAWNYNDKFTERYEQDGALVNNTEKSVNYNRDNALRAVINPVDGTDHRVELTVENSPVLKTQQSANFIIMTNIYEYAKNNAAITAYIYTDRGLVNGVVISNVKGEVSNQGVTVISENPIVNIAPDKMNKVTLEIDDNSVQDPDDMSIYNEEDLVQLIEWNKGMSRQYTATLMNDITLTKEMSDMLTAGEWARTTLMIKTDTKKLTIASDAAANILDYVMVNGTVVVENDLVLGSNSYVNGEFKGFDWIAGSVTIDKQEIKIAENASITVSSAIENKTTGNHLNKQLTVKENKGKFIINANVNKLDAGTNRGEMEVNAAVTLVASSTNMQNATLTIGANGNLACAGNLTNEGKKVDEVEEYAVIYNNGKIYNLKNNYYGKVIVGKEEGIVTNVNSNAGIIDISANIKADLNKKEGTIAYTVAKAAAVTMKAVADAKITDLTVDGGNVTSATTATAATATSVLKVIVTENGANIGGDVASAFTVAKFEINGDATLQNLTIGGNIEVKAGTTTIKGTVDAENSTITLASYDDKKYVTYDAKLQLLSSTDKLYAKEITKASGLKVGNAEVENQGVITLENTDANGVKTSGNPYTPKPADPVKPTPESFNVELVESVRAEGQEVGGTRQFTTLKAMYNYMNEKDTKRSIKESITISRAIWVNETKDSDFYYVYLKNLAAGKEVILGDGLIGELKSSMGMAFGKLTMKNSKNTSKSYIKGDTNQPNVTILTVDEIDYTAGLLYISNGYIQLTGEAQIGAGSTKIRGNKDNYKSLGGGAIVTTNKDKTGGDDALLKWDAQNFKWVSL